MDLNKAIELSYWEHDSKGIFLFESGLCAHVKMSKEKFDEIESKYYEEKLKNIINDSGIRNKTVRQKRSKRINWEGFEKLYYEGYDYRDIAKIIDCGICSIKRKVQEDTLSGALKPRFKGLFADFRKVEQLKEMKRQGKPTREILKYFDCQRHAIVRTLRALRDRGEIE